MLTWHAHTDAVTSLAFVPGGGLLSTGTDGHVRYWDTISGSQVNAWKFEDGVSRYTAAECDLLRVVADATGRYAAVGRRRIGVQFLELASGEVVGELRLPQLDALTPAPGADTVFCLSGGMHRARVWEIRAPDGGLVAGSVLLGSGAPNRTGLAVVPDRTQVIAGGKRLAWPSGKIAGPVTLATGSLFAVSHDGDKLFSAVGTRLAVWGLQVGVLRQKLKGHCAPITGLTTTPDGRKLWTCSLDATVRQWDVDSYRCTQCYGLKVGPLACVAVSPDGLTAAAGSAHNGHIAVWDLD